MSELAHVTIVAGWYELGKTVDPIEAIAQIRAVLHPLFPNSVYVFRARVISEDPLNFSVEVRDYARRYWPDEPA